MVPPSFAQTPEDELLTQKIMPNEYDAETAKTSSSSLAFSSSFSFSPASLSLPPFLIFLFFLLFSIFLSLYTWHSSASFILLPLKSSFSSSSSLFSYFLHMTVFLPVLFTLVYPPPPPHPSSALFSSSLDLLSPSFLPLPLLFFYTF